VKFSTHFKAARANHFFLLGRSREGDSRGIPTNPRAATAGPYPTAAAATGGGGGARASKAAGGDGAVHRVPSCWGSMTWRRWWIPGSGAAALAMCGACWCAAGRRGRDRGGREGGGLRRRSLALTLSLAAADIACRERCLAAVWWALSGADLGSILVKKVGPLFSITGSWPAVWGLLAWLNKGGGPRVSSAQR
jgi:hypothetical protein